MTSFTTVWRMRSFSLRALSGQVKDKVKGNWEKVDKFTGDTGCAVDHYLVSENQGKS